MNFKINHIDHVAIRVKSALASMNWYQEVLGFHAVQKEAWGEYPVMMVRGKCIIAIFPSDHPRAENDQRRLRIDHFAFNVDNENFARAQSFFKKKGVPFYFKDHTFFHSIYLRDPDEHIVELTTLVKEDSDFGIPA